jgi:outer membrane protein
MTRWNAYWMRPIAEIQAGLRLLMVLGVAPAVLVACGPINLNPGRDVAPSEDSARVWIPPVSVASANETTSRLDELRVVDLEPAQPAPAANEYDLPTLVDVALRSNPQTRRAWYQARAAAAQYGRSHSNNYPKVAAEAEAAYFKLPLEFPGETLVIRNGAFLPKIQASYDLLDFGRSRAVERGAREQLIAANFAFNRAIQDVVFEVEKAYYVLSAASASVSAAEANLKLARTSVDAIQERHRVGLATRPQILLAKQVQAQAVYDLENAKSMVHDAEANLRLVVGVAANAPIKIPRREVDHIPQTLGDDVEMLMTDALKRRPDIAAQIAAVRASDAAIARAKAEYYPEVEIGGNYGQIIWSYTVNGGSTQNLNQPFYGTMLTLRWNLFTGFDRYYGVQKAIAERDAARAELRSVQLNASTAVWTAYYDFRSARKKYEASETLVTASQESYDANFESHRRGLATITDLIGAERDLMAARYTLIQTKAGLLISSSAVVHAVGGASASGAPVP